MTDFMIDVARENCHTIISMARNNMAALGKHLDGSTSVLCRRYRRLAIIALTHDADRDAFGKNLLETARLQCAYLRRIKAGATYDPMFYCSGNALGFADALAAGKLELAAEIASLSPAEANTEFEYEDDFLYPFFLQQLLINPRNEARLQELLDRWNVVEEGNSSVYYMLAEALFLKDQDQFDEALDQYIDLWTQGLVNWKKRPDYREEEGRTDGVLSIAGLAILRMADLRGLETMDNYKYMPDVARLPLMKGPT